ncbi:hypothetical protein ACQR3Z_08775 [Nocardia fluminea]
MGGGELKAVQAQHFGGHRHRRAQACGAGKATVGDSVEAAKPNKKNTQVANTMAVLVESMLGVLGARFRELVMSEGLTIGEANKPEPVDDVENGASTHGRRGSLGSDRLRWRATRLSAEDHISVFWGSVSGEVQILVSHPTLPQRK